MAAPDYPGLDTLALHAGAQPDPSTGARATPIYQSASFCFPILITRRRCLTSNVRGTFTPV